MDFNVNSLVNAVINGSPLDDIRIILDRVPIGDKHIAHSMLAAVRAGRDMDVVMLLMNRVPAEFADVYVTQSLTAAIIDGRSMEDVKIILDRVRESGNSLIANSLFIAVRDGRPLDVVMLILDRVPAGNEYIANSLRVARRRDIVRRLDYKRTDDNWKRVQRAARTIQKAWKIYQRRQCQTLLFCLHKFGKTNVDTNVDLVFKLVSPLIFRL